MWQKLLGQCQGKCLPSSTCLLKPEWNLRRLLLCINSAYDIENIFYLMCQLLPLISDSLNDVLRKILKSEARRCSLSSCELVTVFTRDFGQTSGGMHLPSLPFLC